MFEQYRKKGLPVDVICQHKADGGIVPIKIRVKDNEGEYQAYVIKAYKEIKNKGTYTTADGIYVTDQDLLFDCRITDFGRLKPIRLYYNIQTSTWSLGV